MTGKKKGKLQKLDGCTAEIEKKEKSAEFCIPGAMTKAFPMWK